MGVVHNTETHCVRHNQLGPQGEWRNGALTIQAVAVDGNGENDFSLDTNLSNGGVQGGATSGLLWEANIFWHWHERSCYGSTGWYRP